MTQNQRIALNFVATYGRSLYALVIGLFTARWVLMTLGEVDYGLVGVVGGLAGFIAFINNLMAIAVSRFYAFSVGQSQASGENANALEICQRWFNVAVAIHTIIPLVLLVIGYPIGEWAVRHYLTVPPCRIETCVWVFRMSCTVCLVNMMSIPYSAMYYAHQEIAELTIYDFTKTTLNYFFLCYMVSHARDWMLPYVAWTSLLSIVPSLILSVRSFFKFKECRFRISYCWDMPRYGKLLVYAGSRFFVSLAFLLNGNGISVLVNKMLGPAQNAAMTLGHTVSANSMTLSQSLTAAFSPAIANAAGAGNLEQMRALSYKACKFGALALLIFAIPLCLEADTVMRLWLKVPPPQLVSLCICLLGMAVCDKLSDGLRESISAVGKVVKFNLSEAFVWLMALPLSYLFIKSGFGLVGVGIALLLTKFLAIWVRLYFASRIAGVSWRGWFHTVAFPLVISSAASAFFASLPVRFFPSSFLRVVMTTALAEIVLIPLVWFFVCSSDERAYVKSFILNRCKHWGVRK